MTRLHRPIMLIAGLLLSGATVQVLGVEPANTRPSNRQSPASRLQFRRDVVPVLTKLGCNAGACHGSFQGRGGFRLSLWGFDPLADYAALVSDARGRRIFPAAPEFSLIFRKATAAVPHGGGKRLEEDSESYGIL